MPAWSRPGRPCRNGWSTISGPWTDSAARFANAPVAAVAFACTGASYLVGVTEEDETVARVSDRLGVPFRSPPAPAVVRRADPRARRGGGGGGRGGASASSRPTRPSSRRPAVDYWVEAGFEVAAVASAQPRRHPVPPDFYSISASTASETLAALEDQDLEAVVLLSAPACRRCADPWRRPCRPRPRGSFKLALGWRPLFSAVEGRARRREELIAGWSAADWGHATRASTAPPFRGDSPAMLRPRGPTQRMNSYARMPAAIRLEQWPR